MMAQILEPEMEMADFAVSEEKNRWLKARMEQLGVGEQDLEEHFIHASGRGG